LSFRNPFVTSYLYPDFDDVMIDRLASLLREQFDCADRVCPFRETDGSVNAGRVIVGKHHRTWPGALVAEELDQLKEKLAGSGIPSFTLAFAGEDEEDRVLFVYNPLKVDAREKK